MKSKIVIRKAMAAEHAAIGQMLVTVYSALKGFPGPSVQPEYYRMLSNVGELTKNPGTDILVAVDETDAICGAVVFIGDMRYYGSGGTAACEKQAAGFRLLAVSPEHRNQGIGTLLTIACIERAREMGMAKLVIHSTDAMPAAWKIYQGLGFKRARDLDFYQGQYPVSGFRLHLNAYDPE